MKIPRSLPVVTLLIISWVNWLPAQTAQSVVSEKDPAQAATVDYPEADIFLFELSITDLAFAIGRGKNITDRPGYENQPCFTPNSESFLFSQSEGNQTDVFEYFLESGQTKRITNSANMEFSPIPSPDNQIISFVTDGEGANQSIWHLHRDNPSQPVWTLKHQPEREPVGYYSWNHETGYILFWSRYGFNVRLVHQSKPLSHYVAGNAVPTTPQIIPGTNNFSFVHRQGNGEVWIKELDPETRAIRPLTTVVGNNAHYGWAPDGSILMVEGSTLFRRDLSSDDPWQEIVDLQEYGVASASRIAISPDGKWLAVVGLPK